MSYLDILHNQLSIDEGRKVKAYRDTVGKLTIGVGRNLDDIGLHNDEIDLLLSNDIRDAERAARAVLPHFDGLTEARKAVVVNMAFNMGQIKLARFRDTLSAIDRGDYQAAAIEMLDSAWAKQVGERAIRLAFAMKNG